MVFIRNLYYRIIFLGGGGKKKENHEEYAVQHLKADLSFVYKKWKQQK